MYEVIGMRERSIDGRRETAALVLAAAFFALFAYYGWKYYCAEATSFPAFYRAAAALDGHLDQVRRSENLYQAVGYFLHEVLCIAEADLF